MTSGWLGPGGSCTFFLFGFSYGLYERDGRGDIAITYLFILTSACLGVCKKGLFFFSLGNCNLVSIGNAHMVLRGVFFLSSFNLGIGVLVLDST